MKESTFLDCKLTDQVDVVGKETKSPDAEATGGRSFGSSRGIQAVEVN